MSFPTTSPTRSQSPPSWIVPNIQPSATNRIRLHGVGADWGNVLLLEENGVALYADRMAKSPNTPETSYAQVMRFTAPTAKERDASQIYADRSSRVSNASSTNRRAPQGVTKHTNGVKSVLSRHDPFTNQNERSPYRNRHRSTTTSQRVVGRGMRARACPRLESDVVSCGHACLINCSREITANACTNCYL